ncbi:hypothetical protein COOONC_10130 [Cooperia oncophora]
MEVLIERQSITLATSMTATFVLVTFMLCSMCYGTILRFLVKNRFSKYAGVSPIREPALSIYHPEHPLP